jgi:glycosyltransferase involved in cell wall biosynthesis
MIIGIEAERANNPVKTGVEYYAKQLILNLAKIDSANQYRLYLRTAPEEWLRQLPANFHLKVIPFWIFWTQVRISWEMLWHPVDVLLIPASTMPFWHPRKTVVTLHDIAWDIYPQTYTKFVLWYSRIFTWLAVKFCWKVISVSQSTKQDLITKYGLPAEKIAVVHHGYGEEIVKPENQSLSKLLPPKYILFLSTLQPRKNLDGLIDAFKILKQEQPELPHKLVVVGKPGWKFEAILEKIEKYKDLVVYLNHVSGEDKTVILAHAEVLVLPSFYEGFGMQILEAFSAGVPVATSKVSSMPEVAGEAAVYFDPNSPVEIKNAIKNILLDKSLRDWLIEKGKARLKEFSWEKCARETLEVLTKMT